MSRARPGTPGAGSQEWRWSVNRTEKIEQVESLRQTFAETAVVVVTRQVGMKVSEVEKLRAVMRASGTRYKVTKNRLTRLALKGTQFEGLEGVFTGPTAIATSQDPVATAKASIAFANENDKFKIVAGAVGHAVLSPEEVKALSQLPSLELLRSRLVGLLQAPLSKLVGVLPAPAETLVRVVSAPGAKLARVFAAQGQQD